MKKEKFPKENILFAGTHGKSEWRIYEDKVLVLKPLFGCNWGKLASQRDFDYVSPWQKHADIIEKVIVRKEIWANNDASYLFSDLNHCKEINLQGFSTDFSFFMKNMFSGCDSLTNITFVDGFFVVNQVRNMENMFENCSSLEYLDIIDWNINKFCKRDNMFKGCFNLKNINELKNKFLV